jgi:ribose/xylose/arabinose/galactoside ABC-type transport system permease subunit
MSIGSGSTTGADSARRRWDIMDILESYGIYIALAAVLVVAGILAPSFYKPENLLNVLRQAATLGLVGIGQTFVILAGGIDLSVGGVMGTAVVLASDMTGGRDSVLLPVALLCVAAGALVGLINGVLVTKRNVPPFVGTLGMLIALDGFRMAYTKGVPNGSIPPFLRILGRDQTAGIPNVILILIVIFAIAAFVLYRTKFGRQVYATGGNREAARLSGIGVHKVVILTFVISSVLAAITGLILSGYVGYVDRYMGRGFELDSVAAVVVGGTAFAGGKGGLWGTLAGIMLITILFNIVLLLGLNIQYQLVVKGAVIIGAVALYSFRRRSS